MLSNVKGNYSKLNVTFISVWNCWVLLLWHISSKCSFLSYLQYVHSLALIVCSAVWLCQVIYYWKCPAQRYFMHILLQLISSKAAVFFISDENSGWLPISLLLIISFFFDLDCDCSVRHTHLFISFAWWDGLFGCCTDWCTLKMASEASGSLVRVHTWLLHFLYISVSHTWISSSPLCPALPMFCVNNFSKNNNRKHIVVSFKLPKKNV